MNVFGITTLSNSYWSYGPAYSEWEVSSNPFVMERTRYGFRVDRIETRPNWALIIPLAIVLAAAIITVCVLLYRSWVKKNCYPIYFAGKVRYARKGETVYSACECGFPDYDFLKKQTQCLIEEGHKIEGLYTDPALTVPLDKMAKVNAPLYIYPKIEK